MSQTMREVVQGEEPSQLDQVLMDARELTKPWGAQGRLAKELSVPQGRLSQWLSGKRKPCAEVALALRAWVEKQKATQKQTLES